MRKVAIKAARPFAYIRRDASNCWLCFLRKNGKNFGSLLVPQTLKCELPENTSAGFCGIKVRSIKNAYYSAQVVLKLLLLTSACFKAFNFSY